MKIGLVGNIAAGKMSVARIFEGFGFDIVDADKIGWAVIEEVEIKNRLVQQFGPEILSAGKINRKKLGDIVFNDKGSLDQLNKIVHPRLVARLKKQLSKNSNIVLDCALLDKFGLVDDVDYIILVRASKELRMKRLLKNGLSKSEAEARINAQEDDSRFKGIADFVIDNSSDFKKLKEDCYRIWQGVVNDSRL